MRANLLALLLLGMFLLFFWLLAALAVVELAKGIWG